MRNKNLVIWIWAIGFLDLLISNAFAELSTAMALIYGSAIAGGSSILGGLLGRGKKEKSVDITQLPDYPEAEGARKMWWERLQDWGGDPSYGAISPDWAEIWNLAQQRVKDYYSGTATQPGAISKIRASAARRGVSDSPAVDAEITKALVSQGTDIKNLASNEAIQKAQFGEQGRQNWLSSLTGLSNLKPQYNVSPATYQMGAGDMVSGVGGSIGNALTQYSQQKWLSDLMKSQGGGSFVSGGGGW